MVNITAQPLVLYGKVPFKYIYFGLSSYVIVMCGFFFDRRGGLKEVIFIEKINRKGKFNRKGKCNRIVM